MRNYNRQYSTTNTVKEDSYGEYNFENYMEIYDDEQLDRHESRSKVVIEDNTIYEIDMDCYECSKKIHQNP